MSQGPVLLLIDDSGDDLVLAMRALRSLEHPVEVRTARDGREALAALNVLGPSRTPRPLSPCVIFLDIRMPHIDGFEVLRALRGAAHTKSTPVVMMSSSSSPDDVRRAYELGANSYLVKPADGIDGGAIIADAARYWVELNLQPSVG